jgi:hypothetical protein
LQANEYRNQFERVRENIGKFAGCFRSDNHFNFRINNTGGEAEYDRFAAYPEEFYNENKIQISIAEVAKSHRMLMDAMASKMRALTKFRGRISKMIGKMEAGFSMLRVCVISSSSGSLAITHYRYEKNKMYIHRTLFSSTQRNFNIRLI